MKNDVLVIDAHPDKESYIRVLAENYYKQSRLAGCNVALIALRDLKFELNLLHGYRKPLPLEPDLVKAQEQIKNARHIVLLYPNWWGTYPALLKGFIDRTFLPGFAFKYRKGTVYWDKLLKGRSARLIVTMDTPGWFYEKVFGQPGHNSMKKNILEFCGIKPVTIDVFQPLRTSEPETREEWIATVGEMALQDNQMLSVIQPRKE